MSRVSRAYEKGETQGFMKIFIDAETRQILSAAILGTGGDEVIHVLLDVMYAKAPYTVTGGPPVNGTFFSSPLAQKPAHRPSGEKNGAMAPSVPKSGWASD